MAEEEKYKKEADILVEWLKTQDELPKEMEFILLKRYVQSCKCDIEKAKNLIKYSFEFRKKYDYIFFHRDPLSPETQSILKVCDFTMMPLVTKDNIKIGFYRLADFDASKFNFNEAVKAFIMLSDVRYMLPDIRGTREIVNGEIAIFDVNGFSLRHLTKVVLLSVKILIRYVQEAVPVLITQIHFINSSKFLDMLMSILKPFINDEGKKIIHMHLPNSRTLFAYIDQDLLPNEYGGKAGSIKDFKNAWNKEIELKSEYLTNLDNWQMKTTIKK